MHVLKAEVKTGVLLLEPPNLTLTDLTSSWQACPTAPMFHVLLGLTFYMNAGGVSSGPQCMLNKHVMNWGISSALVPKFLT